MVCYGPDFIDWECFTTLLDKIKDVETRGRIQHNPYTAAVAASDAMRIVDSKRKWLSLTFDDKASALVYLLEIYCDMESSEIRDKVYGFLGLVQGVALQDVNEIIPDYSLPPQGVFSEAYQRLQMSPKFAGRKAKEDLIELLRDTLRITHSDAVIESAIKEAAPPRLWEDVVAAARVPYRPSLGSNSPRTALPSSENPSCQQYLQATLGSSPPGNANYLLNSDSRLRAHYRNPNPNTLSSANVPRMLRYPPAHVPAPGPELGNPRVFHQDSTSPSSADEAAAKAMAVETRAAERLNAERLASEGTSAGSVALMAVERKWPPRMDSYNLRR